ncbi:unnamed protein product, partial [Porites lobata]
VHHFLKLSTANTEAKESKLHYLLLIIPVSTFGLGTWQIHRLQWKKGLIKELEERTTQPVQELSENIDKLRAKELEYRRIRLRGKFDHSEEIHVLPRSLNEGPHGGGGLGQRPKSGAHIITPLDLSETGQRILVNRGWVPRDKIEPEKRPEGQIQGEVELVGFIRQGEKRQPFQAKNNPEKNQWCSRDVDAMAEVTGSLPILVDADAASTIPGGPKGGQTRVYLRNEHLQYIITWYALSGFTAYMYYRLRKSPNKPMFK